MEKFHNILVSARKLHQFLEVKTEFKVWISRIIENYCFVENKDFVRVYQKCNTLGGEQEKVKGKATRFYLEDDLNQIQFKETKKLESSRKNSTTKNPTSVVGKSDYTSTENPTTNQSENTDINKTNLLNKTNLIKTTTKLNYIYPIDNPNKKNNSSFILDNSKELKKISD